jgi:hypothetical protein
MEQKRCSWQTTSGEPRWFTRPKENRHFFNISLLMAGLYSFLYLYKAFFIVIDNIGKVDSDLGE